MATGLLISFQPKYISVDESNDNKIYTQSLISNIQGIVIDYIKHLDMTQTLIHIFNQHLHYILLLLLPINLHLILLLLLQIEQQLVLHYICFNLQIYLHIPTTNPTAIPIEKTTDNSKIIMMK